MKFNYRSQHDAARALGTLLREDALGSSEGEQDSDAQRELLLRTVRILGAPGRRKSHALTWAVAAAAALCALGFAWHRFANSALTFAVAGTPRAFGATLSAESGYAEPVQFSDGSAFEMEPGAHLRVESATALGSRLSLIDGKTVAHVVHRPKSTWALTAGPFEVQVTGTRFGATWDPAQQRLSVELYEGSVQVIGGTLRAPVAVRTGQRLEAGPGDGNWWLTSLAAPSGGPSPQPANSAGSVSAPANDTPLGSESDKSDAPSASANPPHAGRAAPDWSALLAQADFEGIVREANALGIEHCFAACSPADLRNLADAARYTSRFALAKSSLLALRRRAPGEAATAAFLLARLNDSHGDTSEALTWYDRDLKEAPNGVYAGEALAGKMAILQRTSGPDAARATAEQYLARFPSGVHQAAAQKIVASAAKP